MESVTVHPQIFLRVKRPRNDHAHASEGEGLEPQAVITCSGLVADKKLRFQRITTGAPEANLALPSPFAASARGAEKSAVATSLRNPSSHSAEETHGSESKHRLDSHYSAKRVPPIATVLERELERRQSRGIELRRELRCKKVQRLRGGIQLIDTSVVAAAHGNDEQEAENCCWDLYQCIGDAEGLCGVDVDEDDFGFGEMSIDGAVSRGERGRLHRTGRGWEDAEAHQLCYNIFGIPDESMWEFDDFVDVLDDEAAPEGYDNYVYFDHRHDDEYDSNAEDHPDNDYPDNDDDGDDRVDDRRGDREDDVEGFWEGDDRDM